MPARLRPLHASGLLAAGAAAVFVVSCSNPPPTVSIDAAVDGVTVVGSLDAPATIDGGVEASVLNTNVRLALLSPLGIGIDVCVRSTSPGAPYQGPLLYLAKQLPSVPDAGHDGATDARPHDAHEHGDASLRDAGEDGSGEAGLARDAGRIDGPVGDARLETSHDGASRDAPVHDARDLDARNDATLDGGRLADGAAADGLAVVDAGPRNEVTVGQVSKYLTVQGGGAFEVAIVVGGSITCSSQTQAPLATRPVSLEPGYFTTLVVVGSLPPATVDGGTGASGMDAARRRDAAGQDAGRPPDATLDGHTDATRAVDAGALDAGAADASLPFLTIVPLVDEPLSAADQNGTSLAHARFFNATTFNGDAGTEDLRVVALQPMIVPLAADVPLHQHGAQSHDSPAVDVLGYWTGPPLSSSVLEGSVTSVYLRVGGRTAADASVDGGVASPSWTFTSPADSFDLTSGSNHSGFLLGGGALPVQLLWCDDNISPTAFNTTCELFPH